MLHPFDYRKPTNLTDALDFLAAEGAESALLAGGTDLLVNIRTGIRKPAHVMDLKGIEPLRQLTYSPDDGLSIGACVTVNELIEHPAVVEHYKLLAVAGSELATYQLRNRATVVGNVVTASPCGDMICALLCLNASITTASTNGSSTMPIGEFITGVKQTRIASNEIVLRITVPTAFADAAGGYKKLKRIKGHDMGIVAVALLKKAGSLRIGIGSAAPTPVLLTDPSANDPVLQICQAAQAAISPISDVRCTKEYRSFMVDVYIKRLMLEVQE